MNKKDEMVFSADKFKKVMRARFGVRLASIFIKNAKGWTKECEGLTPKEMAERHYVSSDAWLVKKSELRREEMK